MAPRFAKHSMRVYQDAKLFRRVDALMKKKSSLGLTEEQARVLDRYHRSFIRSGAALDAKARKRMAAIAERVATLGTKFNQNVLADEQEFLLVLESDAELAGLPDAVRAAAAQTAHERGHKGKHAISLSRSSIEPFLQFSARRDLREQAFKAWRQRGANGGKTDNRKIVAEILSLRAERSRLLGFKTAADAALEFTMAKTPANVRKLLMDVWTPARTRAAEERDCAAAGRAGRRRQFQAGGLGLALLHGESAQGEVRRRRGGGEALPAARQRHRGRVRCRQQAVRGDASRSAPTCRCITPTCAASR